jgi:lipopolysaccharide transport system ATP-binding protein
VRHCTHAVLLHQGGLLAQGEPREISNRYMDLVFGAQPGTEKVTPRSEKKAGPANAPAGPAAPQGASALEEFLHAGTPPSFEKRVGYNHLEYRWGDRSVQIQDYLLQTPMGYNVNHVQSGETVHLYVKVQFHKAVEKPIFGLFIKSTDGVTLFGTNTKEWDGKHSFTPVARGETTVVHFQFQVLLNSGNYLLSLGVAADSGAEVVPLDRRYDSIAIHVKSQGFTHGLVTLPNQIELMKPGA